MLSAGFGYRALLCVSLFLVASAGAQEQSRNTPVQQAAAAAVAEPEAPRVVLQAETTASVLRLMKFSGALRDRAGNPRAGAVGLTFALYKDQQSGPPLWLEVHNAQLDEQGRYTVLLGSTKSEGLPLELFSTGEARWLGVQVNLPGEEEQPRVLLVSVPYALKAADAETLGGKPPSAFLLAEKAESGEKAETKPGAGREAVKEGPGREQVVGTITGEGTLNMVSKFTGANAIGNGSIFDNGFVGIGTTSPSARLHIFEPEPSQNANVRLMGSGQTGSWMDIFAGTAVGFGLFGYGNQPFLFGVGAVERMRITPTGEVGLGTTAPNAKLSVGSGSIADANVPVQISTGTSGTVSYYGANKNGGYGLLWGYENGGFLGTGGVVRMVAADPLLFFVNNNTEAMRITSAGNVGVGTTAPSTKLHTLGTTTLQTDAAANKALVVKAAASQSVNIQEWQDGGGALLASMTKAGTFQGPLGMLLYHPSFQGVSEFLTTGSATFSGNDGHARLSTGSTASSTKDISGGFITELSSSGSYMTAFVGWEAGSTLTANHKFYVLAGGPNGPLLGEGFGFKAVGSALKGITILSSTNTEVDLATALCTGCIYRLLAVRRSGPDRVEFYVQGVLKGTSTTNLPSVASQAYELRVENGASASSAVLLVGAMTIGSPAF